MGGKSRKTGKVSSDFMTRLRIMKERAQKEIIGTKTLRKKRPRAGIGEENETT